MLRYITVVLLFAVHHPLLACIFYIEVLVLFVRLSKLTCCSVSIVFRYESAEMYWRLYDCGVPVKSLVYNKVGHGDFVVNFPSCLHKAGSVRGVVNEFDNDHPLTSVPTRQQLLQQLPPYGADLAQIALGDLDLQYDVKTGDELPLNATNNIKLFDGTQRSGSLNAPATSSVNAV